MTSGTVGETYAAALQHDLVDAGDATLVGVVRRPTGWFHALVEENHPELGPPAELLAAVKALHESFAAQGMCDQGAHNAAWEETQFDAHYLEYLEESEEAQRAIEDLTARIADGEDVFLVCFEGENKRCHRRILREHLRERLDA